MFLRRGGSLVIITTILVAVTVLSLSVAGYFFFQSQQLTNLVKPVPSPVDTSSALKRVQQNEIAGWKLYKNNKLGFSIKIPVNESVDETYINNDWPFVKIDRLGLTIAKSYPQIGDPRLRKAVKSQTVTTSDGIRLELLLSKLGKTPYESDGLLGISEISIAKNSAFTPKIYFHAQVPDAQADVAFSTIAQILSTFKFTSSEQDLRAYRNDKYGFEFKYPARLTVQDSEETPNAYTKGYKFNISLKSSGTPIVTMGGVTSDYSVGRGGMITDSQGFVEKSGQYYCTFVNTLNPIDNRINVAKETNQQMVSYLIFTGVSAPQNAPEMYQFSCVNPGPETTVALINLKGPRYKGFAIEYSKNQTQLSQAEFQNILSSIQVN